MPGRSPAGPLMREHRVIERMIALLDSELGAIRAERTADHGFIVDAVDFIHSYADRCHHGKEEDILFRELRNKPLSPELIAAMEELIADHVFARSVTHGLVSANERYAAGDEAALAEIESALATLVEFYPVHIRKEDRQFFKPCLAYFSAEEQAAMLDEFDDFDRSLIHEKYLGLVEALEERRLPAPGR